MKIRLPGTMPTGTEIARFATLSDACVAVRQLDERGVDVTSLSIVGEDVVMVQDVRAVAGPGRAFLSGAAQGMWVGGVSGMIISLLLRLLMPGGAVALASPLTVVIVVAVMTSLGLGLSRMAALKMSQRGTGVIYSRDLVAATYVLVARWQAQQALSAWRAAAATPGAPQVKQPTAPSSPSPAPLETPSGQPRYGVRLSDRDRAERARPQRGESTLSPGEGERTERE